MIEHNLDVLLHADHIIDLGPEGGDRGGEVIATGTPEKVAEHPMSYTGNYIKEILAAREKKTSPSKPAKPAVTAQSKKNRAREKVK
jgi:excinuclease ABC subunit A